MTIDGEPVAEIDIKGSFLFLGNQLSKEPIKLNIDPYKAIPFVANAASDEERANLRGLAKLVVSSMWFREDRMTKLPRGRKQDENGSYISLRDKFQVPRSLASREIISDIYRTFPFFDSKEVTGFGLMCCDPR
ncbi:hypothetical protein [Sedimentimonas flavescens]|uniref:hypothetical protein n=1 Tax=Sedimentimonas flavescens TaxID=2851012 RepID=UPI001C4A40C5|nr:hypothetical protein [Sedimentimonas flavescens]